MKSLKFDTVNLLCGLLFIGLGIFFGLESLALDLGTAFRMGPGYFPFLLACALCFFGAVILIQSTRVGGEPIGPVAWRGIFLILAAPIFFGLTVRGLGFVPAVFLTALIAAFASSRMKPLTALILSVSLAIFAVLVFSYGLGLPFRRFGPWLDF